MASQWQPQVPCTAAPGPAGRGSKYHSSISQRRQAQRGGPECSGLLTDEWQSRGSPADSSGLRLCPAPVPLPEATSAATPLLLSCSTSHVPTSANSPLSRQPPTSSQQSATSIEGKEGQGRVSASVFPTHPSGSHCTPPSPLHLPAPDNGNTPPGVDSTPEAPHSFMHLVSEYLLWQGPVPCPENTDRNGIRPQEVFSTAEDPKLWVSQSTQTVSAGSPAI